MALSRVGCFKLDYPDLEIQLWKRKQSKQSTFAAKVQVIYIEHLPLYLKQKGRETSGTHYSANYFNLTYWKYYCARLSPKNIYYTA